jgi:acyl-CoA oxidase
VPELGGFRLHDIAFLPYLRGQCDEEQARHWVPLAERYRIIGAYAQTELGHGSNVRRLETTSTFVAESDEFELLTPTLTATKWWSGTLGKTATHAIVMAQLVVGQKQLGVHGFIVQVRSTHDHSPMPGVTIGDIGPKVGELKKKKKKSRRTCVDNLFFLPHSSA